MKVRANGIDIEVEDSGGDGPVVLLVMGLGMQLVAWPEAFVRGFVDAGYRVLRHDNRDIGLSQYFDHVPTPNLMWQAVRQRFGLRVRAPYGIQDMADDALGVLDAMGVERAHVVGISMGGMIAQRMAARAPKRVRSLVSIMSSSGAPGLPGPRADVGAMLMRKPPAGGTAALIEQSLGLVRLIGGTGFAFDEAGVRQRITVALQRAYHPAGVVRQMLAVGADIGVRHRVLPGIASPTLVLHGDVDPLVPIACGRDTALRIPGAQFETIRGMGHDVPGEALPVLLSHILPFVNAVDTDTRES